MSAEVLRRAAALMRERATAATGGQWAHSTVLSGHVYAHGQDVVVGAPRDAEHVASWHPAVALAVADWLDFEANCTDRAARQFPTDQWDADERALAVARAYLGSES